MTSFTERFAAMVGMRVRDKERVITGTDKSKTFGIVTAIQRRLEKEGVIYLILESRHYKSK